MTLIAIRVLPEERWKDTCFLRSRRKGAFSAPTPDISNPEP